MFINKIKKQFFREIFLHICNIYVKFRKIFSKHAFNSILSKSNLHFFFGLFREFFRSNCVRTFSNKVFSEMLQQMSVTIISTKKLYRKTWKKV